MRYTDEQTKMINKLYSQVNDGLITHDEADEQILINLSDNDRECMFIEEKNSYGRTLLYPACERSKEYAQELGKKTFSKSNLQFIESLGIKVECLDLHSPIYWQSRFQALA